MHRDLVRLRRRRERGAVAIIVALSMTALLVLAALVIDFGLVRVDRQVDKSAADSATLAGLHALNGGDGNPHPFLGVCTAIKYLQQNSDRFDSVDENTGWTDGLGTVTADGCTDVTLRAQTCAPGSPASWARWTWSGTYQGAPLSVAIQSGYQIPAGVWGEDNLAASLDDADDDAEGCDQLAIIVTQTREPGLGSLATSSDLKTAIRSVGRVKQIPGGYAPALLLLKRTGCPILQVGAAGGGANSYVHVYGKVSSSGFSQPGTIHADSDGSGCSGSAGNWIFYGKAADGIVTYAAPASGGLPDSSKPGLITSVAGTLGISIDKIRDADPNVYSSGALNEAGAASAPKSRPIGRGLVTRRPVDDRYIPTGAGVRAITSSAWSSVFSPISGVTAANAVAKGYTKVTCSGGGGVVTSSPELTAATKLYVDCGNLKSIPTINAATVVFNGNVSPGTVSMPNATEVYIFGSSGDALTLSSGNTFSMHTSGHTSGAQCMSTQVNGRAKLVIYNGDLKMSGGTLQLCNTTVLMMGGSSNACLPTDSGNAPTQSPCGVGNMGTGQIKQTGGDVDWTAPDEHDAMTLANGDPDPLVAPDWLNTAGPEDLALWSESASNNTSNKASLGGGALLHVRGVFMTPNFDPFTIGGNSVQDLTNAQFIATSIALNGTVQLKLTVDPNSAVTLPTLGVVGLVR
jgi:Flp pilus assembly protein TadG